MANGINQAILLGNLGQDAELRQTSGGTSVLGARLATTTSYMDRNKERQDRTTWHNVTVWGKRAEALAPYLTKGTQIYVQGEIRNSSYEDQEGNKRYKSEVVADEIVLLGRGQKKPRDEEPADEFEDPFEFPPK